MSAQPNPPCSSADLARPPALLALVVLAANDHLLKGAGLLPGWLTGKLSDFAGLFLLPVLLFALARALGVTSPRPRLAAAAALLSAVGFGLIKLVPDANAVASGLLGPVRLDPTDLIALPMSAVAAAWLARAEAPRTPRWLGHVAFVASALACVATSRPLETRGYPEWTRASPSNVGCARLETWVSKSGKEGIGVTVAARKVGTAKSCSLTLSDATFTATGVTARAHALPEPVELVEADTFLYLPFVFDNEALWNQSVEQSTACSARLSLGVAAGGVSQRVELTLIQHLDGPHSWRKVEPPPPAPPPGPPLQMADPTQPLGPSDAGAEP